MRLNHRQIEAFRYAYQTGNMTVAADMLGVTQPAISRLIRDLEGELGFRLFERTRGGLIATSDAAEFFKEVERSFLGLERLVQTAEQIRDLRSGDLKIAATVATSFHLIPDIIRKFKTRWPGVKISLHACASPQVRELIALQHYDVGIAVIPAESPGIESIDLPTLETVCVLPENHPLTRKDMIEPRDLDGEPLLMISDYSITHQRIRRVLEASGIHLNIIFESTFSAPICDLIGQGVGLSILEPITARAHQKGGLTTRRFSPSVLLELKALYPSNRPLSEPAQDFIELLKEALEKTTEQKNRSKTMPGFSAR